MAYHTFGPGLAIDPITMRGIPAAIATLEDAETLDPVEAYTIEDPVEPMDIVTNRYGYFPQFRVPDTVRRLRITIGGVTLEHNAAELLGQSIATASQIAAVAATLTHEWEGPANNAPSIRRLDGEIIARNLTRDPLFENGGVHVTPVSVIDGSVITGADGAKRYRIESKQDLGTYSLVQFDIYPMEPVAPGQYVAFRIDGINYENFEGAVRWRIGTLTNSSWYYPGMTDPDGSESIVGSYQIPANTAGTHVRLVLYFREGAEWDTPLSAGRVVTFGRWASAIGATETEALDQVQEFFTGSTPTRYLPRYELPGGLSDRLAAIETGRSSKLGSAVATITNEWDGPPGESPSTRRIDGKFIARNLNHSSRIMSIADWATYGSPIFELIEDEGEPAIEIKPIEPTYNVYGGYPRRVEVTGGKWVAFRFEIMPLSAWESERMRVAFQGFNGNDTPQAVYHVRPPMGRYSTITVTHQLGPGDGELRTLFWPTNSTLKEKSGFRIRRLITAIADTEAEAIAQVRTFFDGSDGTEYVPRYELPGGLADQVAAIEAGSEPIAIDTTAGTRISIAGHTIHYDSGWRDIQDLIGDISYDGVLAPRARLSRVNNTIYLRLRCKPAPERIGTSDYIHLFDFNLPAGFQETPASYGTLDAVPIGGETISLVNYLGESWLGLTTTGVWQDDEIAATFSFVTADAYPVSLPGTPT